MKYRSATAADARLPAPMNHRLIRDEGHGNSMTASQLEERMSGWLTGEYAGVLCLTMEMRP